MGACGCSVEYIGLLPTPEPTKHYVLGVYPGCRDCGDTDWYLTIEIYDENDDNLSFLFEDLEPLNLNHNFFSERLLSSDRLVKEYEQWCGKPSDLFRDFVDSDLTHVFYNRNDNQ